METLAAALTRSLDTLLGVIVGFLLAFGADWLRRNKMRKAHWGMLDAEISICAERAEWYLKRTVSAPLYRLPTSAFGVSFPVLVSEGDMAPEEFSSLVKYYSWAENINRGLENAAGAAKEHDSNRLQKEETRIDSKCKELLSQHLPPVQQALRNHGVSAKPAGAPADPPAAARPSGG